MPRHWTRKKKRNFGHRIPDILNQTTNADQLNQYTVGAGPCACPVNGQPRGIAGDIGQPRGIAGDIGQPRGVAPTIY